MQLVWPGLVVSPETVTQRVKLVRDALGDDPHAPRYILGVRGRGYRMLAPVEPLTADRIEPKAMPVEATPAAALPASAKPRWRAARALPGALALLIAVVSAAAWWASREDRELRGPTSVVVQPDRTIAVLPLIDISPGGGNEYLGDGLAEELSHHLARVPGLRVAAGTSAFAFKGRQTDVRKIGQSLGVRHVLEGSVRRDGNRIRVTAQLVDALSGYGVWTQSYDRDWKDLPSIHDELARSIVGRLELVLSSEAVQRLARPPTKEPEAFDRYLAGLSKLRQPTSDASLAAAERSFREAIAIDPRFGRAHAGLCETYAMRYERTRDPATASLADTACQKALSLDSSALEVERALASLLLLTGKGDRALAMFRGAVERDPGNADAYIGLARAFERQERPADAEAAYRRAIEIEPGYWAARSAIGKFYVQHGRASQAVPHLKAATELVPASALAFNNLGAALQMTGDLAGAARAFERSLALEPTRSAYSNTGTMYYFLARFPEAAEMYRKASHLASEDHRVWGNLADALHQIDGKGEEAARAYRRAIALAERDLSVNPQDSVGRAQLAFYQARVGDPAAARRNIERALGTTTDLVWVQYYAALVALEAKDESRALTALGRSVELGYPVELVRAAPEFRNLSGNERFERVVARAGKSPPG